MGMCISCQSDFVLCILSAKYWCCLRVSVECVLNFGIRETIFQSNIVVTALYMCIVLTCQYLSDLEKNHYCNDPWTRRESEIYLSDQIYLMQHRLCMCIRKLLAIFLAFMSVNIMKFTSACRCVSAFQEIIVDSIRWSMVFRACQTQFWL